MESNNERNDLIREIEHCIHKLDVETLRRVIWYINRIWK